MLYRSGMTTGALQASIPGGCPHDPEDCNPGAAAALMLQQPQQQQATQLAMLLACKL